MRQDDGTTTSAHKTSEDYIAGGEYCARTVTDFRGQNTYVVDSKEQVQRNDYIVSIERRKVQDVVHEGMLPRDGSSDGDRAIEAIDRRQYRQVVPVRLIEE